MDGAVCYILFFYLIIFGIVVIALRQPGKRTHICITGGIKILQLHRLCHIVGIALCRILLCKGQRGIGTVACKYISACKVYIACRIILIPECLHFLQKDIQVFHPLFLIGCLARLLDQICQNLGICAERALCNRQPAVCIRCIFFIVLCQFGYTGTKPQCTDRCHRIVRWSCQLLGRRHLCTELIL